MDTWTSRSEDDITGVIHDSTKGALKAITGCSKYQASRICYIITAKL